MKNPSPITRARRIEMRRKQSGNPSRCFYCQRQIFFVSKETILLPGHAREARTDSGKTGTRSIASAIKLRVFELGLDWFIGQTETLLKANHRSRALGQQLRIKQSSLS